MTHPHPMDDTTGLAEPLHASGSARAAIAVLKELKLYEKASGGCIAALAAIIAEKTVAPGMLATLIEIERLCGCPKPNLTHIKTIAARERAKATGAMS